MFVISRLFHIFEALIKKSGYQLTTCVELYITAKFNLA